jgi:glycosyltransferase 2 family protein
MAKTSDWIRNGLKLAVGLALVVYVLRSGMIDFKLLGSLLMNPVNLFWGFLFLSISVLCCSMRWYLLVRAQGLTLDLKSVISLSMIGNFFNTFLPGSVGGDLIKAWYVAGREPKKKTRAVFTVLIDRIIGLAVIVFYAATSLVFYLEWLDTHRELKMIAYAVWSFTAVSFTVGFLFFIPGVWKSPFAKKLLTFMRRFEMLGKIIDCTFLYQHHIRVIGVSLFLSAASIFGINIFYYLQGSALGIPMSLSQYFFVAPIAIVVSAVPLLPGGIGTGQVAFFTLFQWMGMPDPGQGSTLCTAVQIYTVLFNCLGAFFYMKFKRNPNHMQPPVKGLSLSRTGS